MKDKTQSRNSQSCCDSCSRHYLSVLFLVGVGFGELRGDLQVFFFSDADVKNLPYRYGGVTFCMKIVSENQTFVFEENSILCN